MNALNFCKTAFIAFVICHVTTYVASTTSKEKSVGVSLPADGYPTTLGHKEGSVGLINLKDHITGNDHLQGREDASNPANIDEEDDTQSSSSSGDINWREINGGILAKLLSKRAPMRQYGNQGRKKRDAQKRLDYDRMGKRGFEGKRFTDAMRLGKRQPPGGVSSFADALRLGKRYSDTMRLGKRSQYDLGKRYSDTMRLGKRSQYDTMRLGKRMDAMRLGKKSAMDTMRLGKRMDEMRFGKRMDQMRLGKRNFNHFLLNDEFLHSISNNNGKRMSDVMRLGKRSDEINQVDPVHTDKTEDKRGLQEFGNNEDDSDEDFFNIKKRMSDLMRLGKREHKSPTTQMYGKRMSDLMRLGKRFGYEDRYGKRSLYDEDMRMGKRGAFTDDMRMGKRMGDVMRLGKRMPDAMRLGKRSIDYNVIEYSPMQHESNDFIHEDDYEDLEDQ